MQYSVIFNFITLQIKPKKKPMANSKVYTFYYPSFIMGIYEKIYVEYESSAQESRRNIERHLWKIRRISHSFVFIDVDMFCSLQA